MLHPIYAAAMMCALMRNSGLFHSRLQYRGEQQQHHHHHHPMLNHHHHPHRNDPSGGGINHSTTAGAVASGGMVGTQSHRSSRGSDTSSAYSGSDTMHSSVPSSDQVRFLVLPPFLCVFMFVVIKCKCKMQPLCTVTNCKTLC